MPLETATQCPLPVANRRLSHRRTSSGTWSQASSRCSISTGGSERPQLVYRGTFICSDGQAADVDLRPRAASDPGSELASNIWSTEREYVEGLADHMTAYWEQDERSSIATSQRNSPTSPVRNDRKSSALLAFDTATVNDHQLTINKQEVRQFIKGEAQRRSAAQQQMAKWSSVLSVIKEIPEQVELVLQEGTDTFTDQLKDGVRVVQTMIDTINQPQSEFERAQVQASQDIQSIPVLAVNAFEAGVLKAKNTVQRHVDGFIHDIVSTGEMGTDHMVEQIRLLPGDLQELAGQAIEEAAQEFKFQAWRQIDTAIQQLPEEQLSQRRKFDLSRKAKQQLVVTVPHGMPDTLCNVGKVAESKVAEVVAEVQNVDTTAQHVTNQVVADALLRGRVDGDRALLSSQLKGGTDGPRNLPFAWASSSPAKQALEGMTWAPAPANPGSFGHPELCTRPCIYYASSQGCLNGMSCDFCHLPHNKRPVHLDKSQRELIKGMAHAKRVALRKGAGKGGKNGTQRRRELAGVIDQVMRKHGSGQDQGSGQTGKAKKGKGKGKGKGVVKPTRRQERRAKRKEVKARRSHFFGEGRRKGDGDSSKGGKVAVTSAADGAKGDRKAVAGVAGGAKRAAAPKRRPRGKWDDGDDEEITSEEDGEGPTPAKKRREDVSEDADSGAEDQELGEDEGEEEELEDEGDSDAEEVADDENEADVEPGSAKAGNGTPGGYVPPHLRKGGASSAGQTAAAVSLKRQLRGAMNKVTEGNLDPSLQEMSTILNKLVPEIGSSASAASLFDVLMPAAIGDPNISVLVLGCHTALATASHLLFGASFGGAALIQAGLWLQRRLLACEASGEATGEDARIAKNCVIFICLLFSFGLVGGGVIFDLIRYIFGGKISEIRIELSLTVLRYAGRGLRAEYTDEFREVLKFVTEAATAIRGGEASPEGSDMRSRVDYLLRELQDLKNNKVSFAVMDRFDMTRTWLTRAPLLGSKKVSDHQLSVPFRFLAEDPPEGWPAGKGATASALRSARTKQKAGASAEGAKADALRAAAVAQRLSTELRQSLFAALMGAEDFEHAAERMAVVAAGSKIGAQEACLVIFHCAIREKVPNPFYEHVADTLCARPQPWGKRFQHNLKRAAVQNLTQVHTYGMRAAIGLAELVAALIALPGVAVPLVIVRFIKFDAAAAGGGSGGIGGILGLFLRHLVESLLHRLPDGPAATAAFEELRKYDDVREGMLLVLDGHVKPRAKPAAEAPAFWEKLRAARRELAKRATHL